MLTTREEICKYVNYSWKTVKRWIKEEHFPAARIDGKWQAEIGEIEAWRFKRYKQKVKSVGERGRLEKTNPGAPATGVHKLRRTIVCGMRCQYNKRFRIVSRIPLVL